MSLDVSKQGIWITGIGVISPLGNTLEQLIAALQGGRSAIGPLTGEHTRSLPLSYGGEAWDFSGKIEDFGDLPNEKKKSIRKGLKVMCREIQMGVAAAQRAIQAAGLEGAAMDPDRTGVIFGSDYITTMPQEFQQAIEKCLADDGQFDFDRWGKDGIAQISPLWLLKYLPNMPACHVAIYNDLRGPNNSITVREASSNLALLESLALMQRGGADRILAGATGSRLHPLRSLHIVLQELVAGSRVATAATAPGLAAGSGGDVSHTGGDGSHTGGDDGVVGPVGPFDRGRQGLVLGEGAATLVLETEATARARGAECWGRLLGCGSSAVSDRRGVADRRQALVNAMRRALEAARRTPDQIGHIHAHGLGTWQADQEEGEAICEVFRGRREPVPVVAAKSYFGNLGAASGLVELVASLVAMRQGHLMPILHLSVIDAGCFPQPACVHLVTSHDVPSGTSVLNVSVTPQGQASAAIVALN